MTQKRKGKKEKKAAAHGHTHWANYDGCWWGMDGKWGLSVIDRLIRAELCVDQWHIISHELRFSQGKEKSPGRGQACSIPQAWENQAEHQHLPLGSRFLLTDQYELVSVTQQGVQFQIIIISLERRNLGIPFTYIPLKKKKKCTFSSSRELTSGWKQTTLQPAPRSNATLPPEPAATKSTAQIGPLKR